MTELNQSQFIDDALASGYKFGYFFTVSTIVASPTNPPEFRITATPRKYPVYGRLSLYIETEGFFHGADKQGQAATNDDPIIPDDTCPGGLIGCNEVVAIQGLRTLAGAEYTYAATHGNGTYGSLAQLGAVGLITPSLTTGQLLGYSLTVTTTLGTPTTPPTFRISAVPQTYGTTGIRSFFVGTDGVIRGADHHGAPADENDPPIS